MLARLLLCLLASADAARRLEVGDCHDDPQWNHKNKGADYGCAWVAENPDTRCSVKGISGNAERYGAVEGIVVASDGCMEACGVCSGDEEETSAQRPMDCTAIHFSGVYEKNMIGHQQLSVDGAIEGKVHADKSFENTYHAEERVARTATSPRRSTTRGPRRAYAWPRCARSMRWLVLIRPSPA